MSKSLLEKINWIVLFGFLWSGCVTEKKVVSRNNINIEEGLQVDLGKSKEEVTNNLLKEFNKNPSDPKVAWKIGWIYFKNRDYTRAEHWFKHSMNLIKDLDKYRGAFYFHYYLGEAYLWQGKVEKAIQCFEQSVEDKGLNPIWKVEFKEFKQAYFHLGVLYTYKQDKKKSDFNFQKYTDLGGSQESVKVEKERIELSRKFSSE